MKNAERAEKLQADYIRAAKAYLEVAEPLLAAFNQELDAALATIRGKNDRRRVAVAARKRVREALHAFGKPDDDDTPLHAAAAEVDRCRHALRSFALADHRSNPLET